MKIEILTIFPQIFDGFKTESLLGKAQERGLLELNITNIRDFADLPHLHVDDSPYGGGAGMVFKAEPLIKAVESAKTRLPDGTVILLTPGGAPFTQKKASELAKLDQAIFICCRYEGIDQRVIELVVDQEISIGDYVLMGRGGRDGRYRSHPQITPGCYWKL